MRIGFRGILFVLIFALPLAAVVIYELRYATDRYHSEAIILITEDQSATQSLDLSTLGLPMVASNKDALTLVAFIGSLDMMQSLEKKLGLRQHFSNPAVDWYSRFDPALPEEKFLEYFQSYVWAEYDVDSQLINIHAQSFDRQFSQSIVTSILERSQEFVDKLNAGVTEEQTQFFEKQLRVSEARLKEAKNELLKFQRENLLSDTTTVVAQINAQIAALESLLISKQGELTVRLSELNETSPVIQVLRTEIESIKQQIIQQKNLLAGASGGLATTELDSKFREIQLNIEFVTNIYKSNLSQLEQARLEAVQRLKYLVIVTTPSLADASLYPDRTYIIGTATMVLLIVFFVLSLMVAIIREHT